MENARLTMTLEKALSTLAPNGHPWSEYYTLESFRSDAVQYAKTVLEESTDGTPEKLMELSVTDDKELFFLAQYRKEV